MTSNVSYVPICNPICSVFQSHIRLLINDLHCQQQDRKPRDGFQNQQTIPNTEKVESSIPL